MSPYGNPESTTPSTARPRRRKASNVSGLLFVVTLWLVASSVYYANTVFTGQFAMELDDGLFHKAFKYVVTLGLAIYLAARFRMWALLFLPAFLAVQILFVQFAYPESRPIVDVYIVVMCMVGLIPLLRVIGEQGNHRIPYIIVATGVVVGIVSAVEIFLLSELFADRWAATGGMRSISTLFNPNNLGLYLSVCAIFLLGVDLRFRIKALAAIPIAFGIVYSGSRTAWISLGAVIALSALYSLTRSTVIRTALVRPRTLITITILAGLSLGAVALWPGDVNSESEKASLRGFDSYTADVRKENALAYVSSFDLGTLLPDVHAANIELTTDSTYLILLNSFGAFPLLLYAVVALAFYRVDTRSRQPFATYWRHVVVFYLIASLADSTVNAFPNNQMFFIALGSVLTYRFSPRSSC